MLVTGLFVHDAMFYKVQGLLCINVTSLDLGLNWIHMWILCSMSWTVFGNFLEAKSTIWMSTLCQGYVLYLPMTRAFLRQIYISLMLGLLCYSLKCCCNKYQNNEISVHFFTSLLYVSMFHCNEHFWNKNYILMRSAFSC